MRQETRRYPAMAAVALAALAWMAMPVTVGAGTSGSYKHPDIPGPDESDAMNRRLNPAEPPSADPRGAHPAVPSTRTEGSASKGYGPGAHPPKSEGSSGRPSGHGKGYGHFNKYSHGSPHGFAHDKDNKEGSTEKKGYGSGHASPHGKQYGHEGSGHRYGRHGHSGHGGHGAHASHRSNPYGHILRFKEKLGLTDQQVDLVQDLRFDWEKQRIKLGADLMIAYMELDKLVHSGTLQEARLHDLAKVIGGLKQQEAQIMVEAKINLLKLLTEEQRKKVAAIHGDHP